MKLYNAEKVEIGNKTIKKIYVGEKLVYPKQEILPGPQPPIEHELPDDYKKLVAVGAPSKSTGITTKAKVFSGFSAEIYGIFDYSTISANVRWFGLGSLVNYQHAKLVVGMLRQNSSWSYNNYPFVVVNDKKVYADNEINFSTLEDHIFCCKITTTPTVKVVLESQNSKDPTVPVITINTDYQIDPQYMEDYFKDMYFSINSSFVLYKVKINSDVSYSMIPVQRKSDSKYGMYDLINQEFFTSTNGYPYYGEFK